MRRIGNKPVTTLVHARIEPKDFEAVVRLTREKKESVSSFLRKLIKDAIAEQENQPKMN